LFTRTGSSRSATAKGASSERLRARCCGASAWVSATRRSSRLFHTREASR
jgi:hypothetical protein